MYLRKTRCFRIISCLLTFSFLITGPSNANITDALKPPKSDSNEILQLGSDVSKAPQFSITDPEKIIIAENMGRVREIFKGNNGKLIINIQDAHCNFEAQTNISQILDLLVKHGLKIVALEGSSGEIDPSIFTTYPDEAIRKEVAAYFLKKGKINGAEYLAITSKNPPQLYGVETKEYYLANLATFLNTLKERDKIKTACASVKNILEKLKERVYSKELKALDERAITNTNDELKLVDYCWFLRQMAESKRVPLDKFANLALLYKTAEIEKTIDFNKVAEERANIISALENTLTQKELEELFAKSVSFKSGRISATIYHIYLRRMALEKNTDYAKYPNLNLYTDYLIIYEKIDTPTLLKEIVGLETAVKEKLFANEDQRALDKLSKSIRLLESMLDISMSKEDVDYYQQNRKDFSSAAFADFINKQAKRYKIQAEYDPNFALVDKCLPDLENFYRIAETRDDAILQNTLKKMDEENAQVVALITGGYHTQGIAERLRNRGISYVVITPTITKAEKDNPYLAILSGEKIPKEANLKTGNAQLALSSAMEKSGVNARDKKTFVTEVDEYFKLLQAQRKAALQGGANIAAIVEKTRRDFTAWDDAEYKRGISLDGRFEKLAEIFVANMQGLRGSPAPWAHSLLTLFQEEMLNSNSPSYKALSEILANPEAVITAQSLQEAIQRNNGSETDTATLKRLVAKAREILVAQVKAELEEWKQQTSPEKHDEFHIEPKLAELISAYGLDIFPSSWPELYNDVIVKGVIGREESDPLYLAIGDLITGVEQNRPLRLGNQATLEPGELDNIFLSRGCYSDDWVLFNKAAFGPGSGCGIMAYFGSRGGIIDVLEAAGRLSYRAPDSTGVAAIATMGGDIVLRRQLKTPTELTQFLYWNPMFEEPTIMTDAGNAPIASLSQSQLNARRRSLLLSEGIQLGDLRDLSFKPDGTGYTLDNLYGFRPTGQAVQRVEVGVGVTGNATGNMSYAIDAKLNVARFLMQQYGFSSSMLRINFKEALRHALAEGMGLSIKDFDARLTLFNKIISNKAPASSLTAEQKDQARFAVIAIENFDKVIAQAILGNLNGPNEPIWDGLWNKVLKGRSIIVTADFDNDCVRHAFRLVAGNVVAPMVVWPYIEKEVEDRFRAKVAGTPYGNKSWREAWMEEAAFNTPGRAFEAAVEWFQYKNIPQKHWPKVVFGRVSGITAELLVEMVSGHGRWGMMGGITIANAHPHPDSKFNRALTLNGALNVNTFAHLRKEQADAGYIHRSENDTEVIVYEIEKTFDDAQKSGQPIPDEEAARRALIRMKEGSEMAVAVLSKYSPGTMYVASYNRPVAIVVKGGEIMVSSDINAALGLWPAPEVEQAVREITVINAQANEAGKEARQNIVGAQELDARLKQINQEADAKIAEITKRFKGEAIFLEGTGQGQFAKIFKVVNDKGEVEVRVEVSTFEGQPLEVKREAVEINPAQVGKGIYSTFLEYHIHEIPGIQRKILDNYVAVDGRIQLDATWSGDQLLKAGLNIHKLQERFGQDLRNLKRIFLIGVGSSYRDAMAAKVFLESVLPPEVEILIYDPVEILNKGVKLNPRADLAINITWSGTTASIKKAHEYFAQHNVMDIALTGKIQSDLARVTRESGGAIDVLSGIEVSVCTVKGYESILFAHMLLGLQLGQMMNPDRYYHDEVRQLREIPKMVEEELDNEGLRAIIDKTADRFKDYTKVAVLGTQPVDLEGELKMEEVNWIVGAAFDPDDTSAWDAIEKSARLPDNEKVMVIVNATDEDRLEDAMWAMERLEALGVPYVVHTYSHKHLSRILQFKGCEGHVYVVSKVAKPLQSLIDAPFYFQLALALAKAKGIPAEGAPSIDVCRNLTKSVVVTGAEEQAALERQASEFKPMAVGAFAQIDWQHGYQQYMVDMQRPVFETPDQQIIAQQPMAAKALVDASVKDTRIQIEGINTKLLTTRFGNRLSELKRVIILTDEEVTQNAALAAQAYFEHIFGVRAEVCRSYNIPKNIDKNDTLVIAIGRSNRRHGSRNDLSAPLQRFHEQGAAVVVAADTFSPAYATGKLNAGSIGLQFDLDELSMYEASYLSLAAIALKLSEVKGVEGLAEYIQALKALPYNMARVVQDRKLLNDIKDVARAFKQYSKVHIIGGAQAYATAQELARNLRRQGVFAEAQYNDSAWHGPLAVVNPDTDAPPSANTLVIVLATDSNFKLSSLLDSQVYNTRNAKIVLVVQEGEEQVAGVNSVGAYKVIAVPKAPNVFTNPSDVIFAQLLATEYGKARGDDGKTLAKHVIGEELDAAAKRKVLEERGLTETDAYYITKDGGKIAKNVNLLNINPAATVSDGGVVRGAATFLPKDSVVSGNSLANNVKAAPGARIENASYVDGGDKGIVVRGNVSNAVVESIPDSEGWQFSEGSHYRVYNGPTVIDSGATVTNQADVVNTFVGANTSISGSPVWFSEIGPDSEISDFARIDLIHTEPNFHATGPTEFSEGWGAYGQRVIKLAYIEAIFMNEVTTLSRDNAGNIVPRVRKGIPNASLVGEQAIFSGYDGTAEPPADGAWKRTTGKEKSRHGTVVVAPGSAIGADIRLIAKMGHPDLSDPNAILQERDLTYLWPFSVCGFEGAEAWGHMLPGERRKGLSPRQADYAWTFTFAPELIITQMERMAMLLRNMRPDDPTAVNILDGLPEELLETGKILTEQRLKEIRAQLETDPGNAKLKEQIPSLERGLEAYDAHLKSRAWEYRNGDFVSKWQWDGSKNMYVNPRLDLSSLVQDKAGYKQYKVADLMSDKRAQDKRTIQPVLKTQELIDRIGRPHIDLGCQVGGDADLIGSTMTNRANVGQGATVFGSYVDDGVIGEKAKVLKTISLRSKIADGIRVANSRLTDSIVKTDCSSAVLAQTYAEKGSKIRPGTVARGCVLDRKSVLGGLATNYRAGVGAVSQHMATNINNVNADNVKVTIDGRERRLPNVTNIAGGCMVGLPNAREIVALNNVFLGSGTFVAPGAEISFCSYVKGIVHGNERLLPFTLRRSDRASDEIGGVLDMPEIIRRHLLSKMFAVLLDNQKEDIEGVMEYYIKAAITQVQNLLEVKQNNSDAVKYSFEQLRNGLSRLKRNLDGRWKMKVVKVDGELQLEFTEGQWRYVPEGETYRWEPDNPQQDPPATLFEEPNPGAADAVIQGI